MVDDPLVAVKMITSVLGLTARGVLLSMIFAPPCELPDGASADCPCDWTRGAAGLPLVCTGTEPCWTVLDTPPACCPDCDCWTFEETPCTAELAAEFSVFTLAATTAAPLTGATPTLLTVESTGASTAGGFDIGAATAEP